MGSCFVVKLYDEKKKSERVKFTVDHDKSVAPSYFFEPLFEYILNIKSM